MPTPVTRDHAHATNVTHDHAQATCFMNSLPVVSGSFSYFKQQCHISSCATVITDKRLKTLFLPFPNVTADTRVLMSGLTVVELLDAGKKKK